MKYDTWTPVPMFCANCGHLNYGYRNENGIIKYECKNCKVVLVRKQKGRRHDTNETKTFLQGEIMMDAEGHNRKMQELPIWEKPLLSVVEAAKYFQIGESNIRRLTREHKDKDFVLWKDNRVYIRRKEMESFLDTINEI